MRKSSGFARGIRTTRADERAVAGRARVQFGDARKDQRACRAEERPARSGIYDAGSIEGQRPPPFMDVGPDTGTWRKIKAVLRADGSWRTSLEAVDDNSETDFRCRRQIAGTRKTETGANLRDNTIKKQGYGRSELGRDHRFVISYVYELPNLRNPRQAVRMPTCLPPAEFRTG